MDFLRGCNFQCICLVSLDKINYKPVILALMVNIRMIMAKHLEIFPLSKVVDEKYSAIFNHKIPLEF